MDPVVRTAEEEATVKWAGELADRLAEKSAEYDHAGRFVDGQIEILLKAGYGALTAPREYGGRGANLYSFLLAQERLAEGDSSAALVLGWHLGITMGLQDTRAWPEELFRSFCEATAAGRALINSCASEPETGSPSRGGRPTTTAELAEGGYRINGRKTWATGSLSLTHFVITAYVPELDRVGEFLVLKGSSGLSIEETWDTMSMRGTGSHTVRLNHVFVPAECGLDFVPPGQKTKRSTDGSGWMLHIPATYLGVANIARRYALDFARRHAPNSLGGKPIATVPQVRDKLGRIEALRQSARTLLYATAARYDDLPLEDRPAMRPDLGLAKYTATNAAIQIVDLAMRIVGGNSLWNDTPLERCYRDVRAGLHNPPMDDVVLSMLADRALTESAAAD